jgi:heavy metal translocating P-type ATPase
VRSPSASLGLSRASIQDALPRALPVVAALGIACGAVLHLSGSGEAGDAVWAASIALLLVPLTWSVVRALAHGDAGVDVIALLAMGTALALGQYLAGAVVALMWSGGNALELYADRRARRELTSLLERAPRVAHRRRAELLEEVPVEEVVAGDVVVVRAGEVVPVDGAVESAEAVIDESTLTGEPLPVSYARGGAVRSGSANAGEPFDLRASRAASESAYAALVRVVQAAGAQRAPFVRLADRYAAVFLPVTLATAGLAWALSGDSVRALAVLVVATPCPLILAAPIALIAGVSRAAKSGIIVKGAAAIERLGRVRTVLLDKTGTLTIGAPAIDRIVTLDGIPPDDLLRLAASVDQLSAHVLAEAIVHEALARGLVLSAPHEVAEDPGQGIEGTVDGRRVVVGSGTWLSRHHSDSAAQAARLLDGQELGGRARILVGVDGRLAGALILADHLRDDAHALVERLHRAGIQNVAMVTGDKREVADQIAGQAGLDRVYAELTPQTKLEVVRTVQSNPRLRPVMMVGDGVNDAPALALADVGVAMATAGATVSSETADAVITVDRIDRVADALAIGTRSLQIARQSVLYGMGLSLVAMGFAAFGFIPPVGGALLQEGIDVAVILNALRALGGGRPR